MLAWYWRESHNVLNFGEHITPYILDYYNIEWKKFSDRSDSDDKCIIIIIGSELHRTQMELFKKSGMKEIHVWGQGKGTGEKFNPKDYNVKFHLIRGETTRKDLGLDSSIPTGDPGFVMPLICNIQRKKATNIIYMPHWQHREKIQVKEKLWGFNKYIDIMMPKESFLPVLDQLANARFVMTTSLHVSIICLAYKVPFCIIKTKEENLSYYPKKWDDVFDWVGVKMQVCDNFAEGVSWWRENVKDREIPDPKNILDTFPFNIFD
jgi:hypothetical protein